jgi:hypothetical protein
VSEGLSYTGRQGGAKQVSGDARRACQENVTVLCLFNCSIQF